MVGVVADREHLASVATSGVDSDSGGRYRMGKNNVKNLYVKIIPVGTD